MGVRSFTVCLALVTLVVLLSAAPFPGALIGFACGVAVAFFVAPLVFLIDAVARGIGLAPAFEQILLALLALYGVGILVTLNRVRLLFAQGAADAARSTGLRAIVLAVLPVIAWLSTRALEQAWP